MIYSVWNQPRREYDYYENKQLQLNANTPSPSHIRPASLGVPVDRAGWPLPKDAVRTGSGELPKGRIASVKSQSSLGEIPVSKNTVGMVGFGLVALLLWYEGFHKKS